jgi:hypothetical protein
MEAYSREDPNRKNPYITMTGKPSTRGAYRKVDKTNRKEELSTTGSKQKRVALNVEEFEKLAKIQCTLEELAWWFGCTKKTITNRIKTEPYKSAWERGKAEGCISIRRAQMAAVQDPQCKGHSTMLVWLGKIFLGQRETQEINLNQQENVERGPYQHPFVTEEEALPFGKVKPGDYHFHPKKKKTEEKDGDPIH